MATDFYQTLGIERNADDAEIKRAYRQLARKHHPDVASDKVAAEAHFKEINEAYETLSDPRKRDMYDRYGRVGPNGASGGFEGFGPSEGFSDLFDMFFGGSRGQTAQPAGPGHGADLRYDLEITLEEAYRGAERPITFASLAACETCKGSGARPGSLIAGCDRCKGSGVVRAVRQTPLGQFVTQATCTKCNGEGHTIPNPCEACRGRGRVERTRTLNVRIPAGVDDGSRIRVTGHGEAGARGGSAGDLYVYLSVQPHPRFRRNGVDLQVDVPISFAQAALGGPLTVETLDPEQPVEIHVLAGTQSGATYRQRGAGLPGVRGGSHGDLLVRLNVAVPTKLTPRERELLEELAHIEGNRTEERSFFNRVKDAFKVE
ncbi:MAG: molecular chaperone DnaJ [Candidatus Baltobacteraceae bacterium]